MDLLDIDTFCSDLPEVETAQFIQKNKFSPRGLFSEQIFGPVTSYTCQCGIFYTAAHEGKQCPACGVDIVSSDERRKRFAKITLPFKVVNPVFYDWIKNLVGTRISKNIDTLLYKEDYVLYAEDEDSYVVTQKSLVPPGVTYYEHLEAIYKLVQFIFSPSYAEHSSLFQKVTKNLDKLFVDKVIVLPPELRPIMFVGSVRNQVLDEINQHYLSILTTKEAISSTIVNIRNDPKLYRQYFNKLQKAYFALYRNILTKLSKKKGIIRNNILGKRIDFSGRCVIVPDPTLEFGTCSIPYLVFLEIWKLKVAKFLYHKGKSSNLNLALDLIDECIAKNDTSLFPICQQLAEGEYVLLNRQPSLHRLSILGFKIKVHKEPVIKIHPLVCNPYNADFDGDQMAIYAPVLKESKKEVETKFSCFANIQNPADDSISFVPNQDIVLGLFLLTKNEDGNKVLCKGENITEGRAKFNQILPPDFPLVNEPITKKKLLQILDALKNSYPPEVVVDVLERSKDLGFFVSTKNGTTMSLKGFNYSDLVPIRDSIYGTNLQHQANSSEVISAQLQALQSNEIKQKIQDIFPYSSIIDSGSRGSWEQARQLILSRGYVSNFAGEIVERPVVKCLTEGLSPEEFFTSTYGVRKGLLDVALNTGNSGYLSRQLDFACINLELDLNLDDCGTNDYLELSIDSNELASSLIGRFFKFSLSDVNLLEVTRDRLPDIVGKTIYLRSPIYCKSLKICKTCYGTLASKLHSPYIGAIAAQSLGECNTQLILRTFHTSGVANIRGSKKESSEKVRQYDIASELPAISYILHHPDNFTPAQVVKKLFSIYVSRRKLLLIHFECVVCQMAWAGETKWRTLPDRDNVPMSLISIQKIPSKESYLLGLAFSRPSLHIIKSLTSSRGYHGVVDQVLFFNMREER